MGSNTIDNYIQVCPKNGICHYVNTRVYIMAQTSRLAEKSAIADSSEHLINLNHWQNEKIRIIWRGGINGIIVSNWN